MMLIGDVPVQTGQNLVVALVGREAGPAASVITVLALCEVRDGLKVRELGARDVLSDISHTIGRTAPR